MRDPALGSEHIWNNVCERYFGHQVNYSDLCPVGARFGYRIAQISSIVRRNKGDKCQRAILRKRIRIQENPRLAIPVILNVQNRLLLEAIIQEEVILSPNLLCRAIAREIHELAHSLAQFLAKRDLRKILLRQ